MKNMISLLAVALFAVTFSAGCGKAKKCEDYNNKGEEACKKKENFENNLECMWKPAADAGTDAKKGTCVAKVTQDADICKAANKDQAACDDASGKLADKAKKECKFTAGADAASNKCELADK